MPMADSLGQRNWKRLHRSTAKYPGRTLPLDFSEPSRGEMPDPTIRRLSAYQRMFNQMADEGIRIASSADLARRSGLNPPQIRKDLAYFGKFGVRDKKNRKWNCRRSKRSGAGRRHPACRGKSAGNFELCSHSGHRPLPRHNQICGPGQRTRASLLLPIEKR